MKLVYEVLDEVRKKRSKADKIKVLQDNESWALKDIIRGSMDSTVEFNVPDGPPPYTPNRPESVPSNLLKRHRDFINFAKGGPGDKLPAFKRERSYIQLLEGIHPEDAIWVINMVSKTQHRWLTRPIVEEAFPGLLRDS